MFGKRQKENNLEEIKPKGKKKKGRKKKVIAGVVIVAVLGTAGTAVYSKTQKQPGNHSEVKEAKSAEVTLGNISNTQVPMNTVDIGLPQLAMHSPYETAGVKDTEYLVRAAEGLFA